MSRFHCFHKAPSSSSNSLTAWNVAQIASIIFIIGLSVSISGPTLIFLEELAYAWEDEVALIFTGRSIGCLTGLFISNALFDSPKQNYGCLVGIGMLGLSITHFCIPLTKHLWWLMATFAFQGAFMIFGVQGSFCFITTRSGRSYRRFHEFFVAFGFLGCAIAPCLIVPLTPNIHISSNASSLITVKHELNNLPGLVDNATVSPNHILHIIKLRSRRSFENSISNLPFALSELQNTSKLLDNESNHVWNGSKFLANDSSILRNNSLFNPYTEDAAILNERINSLAQYTSNVTNPETKNINSSTTNFNSSKYFFNSTTAITTLTTTNHPNTTLQLKKPAIVDASHLSQDHETADGSHTAEKMKQVDDKARSAENQDDKIDNAVFDIIEHKANLNDTVKNNSSSDASSQTPAPILNITSTTSNVLPNKTVLAVNTSKHKIKTKSLNTSKVHPATSINMGNTNSIDKISVHDESHHKSKRPELSHATNSSKLARARKWSRMLSSTLDRESISEIELKALRRIYFSLAVLTLIVWLIALPITGWLVRPCTYSWWCRSQTNSGTTKNNVSNILNVTHTYLEPMHDIDPLLQTIWPTVFWPTDFWLYFAAFTLGGLECTYGAFLHSFALHNLPGIQSNALWATGLFWLGDLTGRLFFLITIKVADMGVTLLQSSSQGSGSIPHSASFSVNMVENPSSGYSNKCELAAMIGRTVGSLVSVCSSSFFLSLNPDGSETYIFFVTWLGSFGLGLGIGMTASAGLAMNSPRGGNLHLAAIVGQMFFPAVAGYIFERMLHKNASSNLGRTAFILSLIIFVSLLLDAIFRAAQQFRWFTDIFPQRENPIIAGSHYNARNARFKLSHGDERRKISTSSSYGFLMYDFYRRYDNCE